MEVYGAPCYIIWRMCGICGAIGGDNELAATRVRRMMAAMIHRGPDEDGILSEPGAILGMRRLSIIDLGGGRQPVYNEDGTIGIVFNGEIYNFPQCAAPARIRRPSLSHAHRYRSDRSRLRRMGRSLRGASAVCSRFRPMGRPRRCTRGEWQRRKDTRLSRARPPRHQTVVLRDRRRRAAIRASEVRSLLASGAIERRIEPESVEAYLLFGSVVEPMTLVKGAFSLPPGHAMTISCDSPVLAKPSAYWSVGAARAEPPGKVLKDLESAARAVVRPQAWKKQCAAT